MKVNREIVSKTTNVSPFLKIQEGKTKVRIVSDVHGVKEHRIEVGGQARMIACPKENEYWKRMTEGEQTDEALPRCPLCEKKYPVNTSFIALVINRENGEIKVLKKGKTVFGPLMNYQEDIGDIKGYDIVIRAEGKGVNTKYEVSPSIKDNKPITGDEEVRVKQTDIDLDLMTTPRSYDEIVDIIGENYPVFVPKNEGNSY